MCDSTMVECPLCQGSGLNTVQDDICPMCEGSGSVTQAEYDEFDSHMTPGGEK